MPSYISCPEGHASKSVSVHEAAVALSDLRAIGVCKKCGKELQYKVDSVFAKDPAGKQHTYIATRAIRLLTRLGGDKHYDPFLLVLKNLESGEEQIMPTFWAYGQNNTQRGGQFPPLLSLEEWKSLFRQLDGGTDELIAKIHVRAYQLYEQRGRRDGDALKDWLQAEAELTARKKLRVAA